MSFVQYINTSVVALLSPQAISEGLTSVIEVTPKAIGDFQTLICRAANSIGRQQKGCHITLVPSGKISYYPYPFRWVAILRLFPRVGCHITLIPL